MKESKRRFSEFAAFCLGILLIGVLIQIAGQLKGDRIVFPSVPEILRAFFALLKKVETWKKIFVTLLHLVESVAMASLLGLAAGLLQYASRFLKHMFDPLLMMIRSIPMIVMVVIVMVLAPYRYVPLIATTVFLLPVISEATYEGCSRIDDTLKDEYKLNSSLSLYVLYKVYLPLIGGYLKQAYVNAVGSGLKMVVTTEYLVQTRDSLGKAVFSSSYFNEYADIYAYALIMILLVLAVSGIPRAVRCVRQGRGVRD